MVPDLYDKKNEMVPDGNMDLYNVDLLDELPDLVSDDESESSDGYSTEYNTADDGYGSDSEGEFRYNDALPSEDNNAINSIKEVSMISNREDNSYKSCLWGDVRSSGGGKVHRVKMMLDCGNLLPDAVAISKSFFLRSGLKLVSKKARRCTTAKAGGSIKAIGIASPICIRVPGISKTVEIQAPIILEGLTDEVNLGNKALQQWKVNMTFRPDGTYLYTQSGGESVALIANLTDDAPSQAPGESRGRGTKRVHTQKSCPEYVCPGKRQREKEPERMPSKQDIIAGCDTVLKPNHLTFIQC